MRASRLVALLLLLQTRGRMTGEELARELEVSVRTIYRDLEALSAAGVPVYAERGPHGGCQLVDGYRTRLTGLSPDEAEALFLSGLPGPAAELGLGTVLAAAQLKVLAALPPELRGRAARVRQRFHLVAPGWFKADEAVPHLPTISEAVWAGFKVRMSYRREGETVERLVEPFGLVLKAGVWYLVGRREGVLRTYRVSRIRAAERTEERFERPPDFDLAAYWEASTAEFEESFERVSVTLRISPSAIGALASAVGGARVREAVESAPTAGTDGWQTLTVPIERDWARDDLLRLGGQVEIIEPVWLREEMAASARAMFAHYGSGTAPISA